MTEPVPISTAAIQARAAQQEARELIAKQVLSEERFEESVDTGFNPTAAARQQERMGRFRTLDSRVKAQEKQDKKIEEVNKEAETDDSLAGDFSRRNPELDPDKLSRLRNDIKEGDTPEQILREVLKAFKDPTLADEAIDFLERSSTGFLKESVQKARGLLNEAKGREIIAGRNIAPVVKSFHKQGLGDNPTELRDLYRNITGNPRDHNVLFSELASKYPFDELKTVVAFLLKSLGYDLKSKGPSIQQAELVRLMTDTRNLQSILWVYLFFKSRMKMVRQLLSKHKAKSTKVLTFELLAKEFIKLVEDRYPSVMKLLKQAEHLGLLDDEAKVIVLTQFRDAIRGLSPRLYKSVKARQDLLVVILETLEDLEADDEIEEE
jgi:type III secretion protein W